MTHFLTRLAVRWLERQGHIVSDPKQSTDDAGAVWSITPEVKVFGWDDFVVIGQPVSGVTVSRAESLRVSNPKQAKGTEPT